MAGDLGDLVAWREAAQLAEAAIAVARRVARGSAAELESHLWLAGRTQRCTEVEAGDLVRRVRYVRALLRGLLRATANATARG